MPRPPEQPLQALNLVMQSLVAARNGRALFLLLWSFAGGGLLLAMAQSALARDALPLAVAWGGLALSVAFYGANAAGLVLMDEACGRRPRDVVDALRDALLGAHRLILVLLGVAFAGALLLAALVALLWAARLPRVGPLLFAALVPAAVVLLGAFALAVVGVVGPLAAPCVWSGLSVRAAWAFLAAQVRRRLLFVALLGIAGSLLATAVAALVGFGVAVGGRAVALLAVLVLQVDLPPQQLMAGLFGFGLRTLAPTGAAVTHNPYGAAALVGGGVVFALALVLPGAVYLRAGCAAFLAVREADALRAAAANGKG